MTLKFLCLLSQFLYLVCSQIITGQPSHGDFIICWQNNTQIVLSGSPCRSHRRGEGHSSISQLDNKDVQDLYEKLLSYKKLTKCENLYSSYYVVAITGTCMMSSSHLSIIDELEELIPKNWTKPDITGSFQSDGIKATFYVPFWSLVYLIF